MRFTISREKLQEGLAAVTATIPTKTTLPVLATDRTTSPRCTVWVVASAGTVVAVAVGRFTAP